MNPRREELVRLLADGCEHSGEDLARTLRVSRAAVWKHVRTLGGLGLTVHSVPRRGYRLDRRLDLLDPDSLLRYLRRAGDVPLRSMRLELEVGSTSSELLAAGPPPPGQMDVCIAEHQTSGRGRRGRTWFAPLGSGLCLSMSWSFAALPHQISSLGLVAGVAVAVAVDSFGVPGVKLKWPNDLWIEGHKLGGILIEMRAETLGPAFVVIGVGLNVDIPDAVRGAIAREGVPGVDLRTVCPGSPPSRTMLASRIIVEMVGALRRFAVDGLTPFLPAWRSRDALLGQLVRVVHPDQVFEGGACGIDDDGALLLATPAGLKRQVSGEVSVRMVGT